MVQTDAARAPYAPIASVIEVIQRMRERGLPQTIDNDVLGTIGVAEGNQPRTLAALKFLRLVSDGNQRTEALERIGRAGTEEYPEVLAEILREAYAPVFLITNPAEDGIDRVTDAFRSYAPAAQRSRMVTLFMGLCTEARIVTREAPATARRTRSVDDIRRSRSQPGRQRAKQLDAPPADGPDLRAIHTIVDQLPPEGWWTDGLRARWLIMLEGAVDYAVEVRDEPPPPAPEDEEDDIE